MSEESKADEASGKQPCSDCPRKGEVVSDVEDIVEDEIRARLPPVVPCYFPYRRVLEPGTKYLWCKCGRASKKSQPFCDKSCGPNDPQPVEIVVEKRERVQLCGCKYTASPTGLCDGSHANVYVGYEQAANSSQ